MTLVGKEFPSITVEAFDAENGKINLDVLEEAKSKNQKVLLFWYPKDFTFVCPTELHAFQKASTEFLARNTKIIAASCDTSEVHLAWLNTPKDQGGIEGISYPIIADSNRNLSSKLGILDARPNKENGLLEGDNVTYRATYLIDEEGSVFHESINHMPLGRNVDEFLRLIDAYSHVQEHGEVCPANWEEGKEAMIADSNGVANYLSKN